MALFTGAFFVAQVSLIIVAKPFYAMVDNLERLGTLWYAMKQI